MGKKEYVIGYDYKDGTGYYPYDIFNAQHAITVLKNGDVLLFNNNAMQPKGASSIIILSPPKRKSPPTKKWEYTFNFENAKYNMVSKQGGVQQLPNGNLLVCMGANSKVIEITMDKELVWEADVEKYNSAKDRFNVYPTGYRGSFTNSLHADFK